VVFEIIDLENQGNARIADKYGITAIPTLVFLGKDGSINGMLIGIATKDTIDQNIAKILN